MSISKFPSLIASRAFRLNLSAFVFLEKEVKKKLTSIYVNAKMITKYSAMKTEDGWIKKLKTTEHDFKRAT